MFFGQTVTFTNPILNRDRTRSLTPPDNPVSYVESSPRAGMVFLYNTLTGARTQVMKESLPIHGFDVDSYGNPIALPVQATSTPINYYPIYEVPGVSIYIVWDALRQAGFGPQSIKQNPNAPSRSNMFLVPYATNEELALIQGAEQDYMALSVSTSGPPLPPGTITTQEVTPVITVPNIATAQSGLQGLLSMKVFGISAPLVAGGALLLLLILRR